MQDTRQAKKKIVGKGCDLVIVEPWEFSGDGKGDVLYKYTNAQMAFLRRKGYLKKMDEFEEF